MLPVKLLNGRIACALALLLVCSGCDRRGGDPGAGAPAVVRDTIDHAPADPRTFAIPRITPEGIGAARVGMTLDSIRRELAPPLRLGELDERFMVDLVAFPVLAGPDTLYSLVFAAGEAITEGTVPLLVATSHEEVQTPDGVGPGTSLGEAARRYGNPVLSYSVYDEMREYASFPDYTNTRVRFRIAPGDSTLLAGKYSTNDEYNETDVFDGSARIGMIFVSLRRD